jgi:hypothetical protein
MAGALWDDYRARNAAAGVRFPWNGGGAEQTSGQGMAAWVITNGRLCAYFMPLLAVELIFNLLHLVPAQRNAAVIEAYIAWNYTTWLKLAFLILAAVLLARFVTSGGLPLLTMMGGSPDHTTHHAGHEQDRPDARHPAKHHHHGSEHSGEDD